MAHKDAISPRILKRRYMGSSMNTTLGQMLIQRKIGNDILDQQCWEGRRVLGYKLPIWQRPERWSESQCVRFIESIWLGVGIGSFMINSSFRNKDADLILLDGQQRLRAIERYCDGEFAMTGEDGREYRWTELTPEEQAHFLRIPFPWVETRYEDDASLRDAYNRHNFGGTAHEEHERA